MSNYIDMDITMERLNDEIDVCDTLIGGHIMKGVTIDDLKPLARLRANLSLQRKEMRDAMDKAESVTEIYVDSDSFIEVETVQ